MAQQVCIQVLGNFVITVDGVRTENLAARSRKGVSLLIYLILQRGKPVSIQHLINAFWGAKQGKSSESALKTRVCRLRALLNGVAPGLSQCVRSENGTYRYQALDFVRVDVLDMLSSIQALSDDQTAETRLALCQNVLDLYQGELFLTGDMADDALQSSWLHRAYLDTVYTYVNLLRERQADEALAAACRQALRQEPLDDFLCLELMRALIRLGKPADAAQVYRLAARLSREMLDSEPSEELRVCYRELPEEARRTDTPAANACR